ncbi:glycerate kinase type-2 family protein [Allorhodopirellula solitaria]|uniref:Putative hydroxypyruvate reductase n=1 Tax=Allorhodopirellula solitaria TaxID=2527987 RepID=A0A5C5YFU9_9BACT|nr:DUF4147 domain-containing protein [Allorhodopirellula solitaria]TWT74180.1 putative hydroxypyruvate reductase [Allorhodopirellula solitaria]
MRDLRRDGTEIFQASIEAVRGDALIASAVSIDRHCLRLGPISVDRSTFDRVVVVGAGKASGAMAVGLVRALGRGRDGSNPCCEIAGQVNVPEGSAAVPSDIAWPADLALVAARPAAVNEPTPQAIAATEQILQHVRASGERDLIVVLISGGGSALLCQPVSGVSLDEKLAVTRHLSGSGADITQLNTVRKHLSEVKGNGLARAVKDAAMVTLVLSDVLGDPLDLIASGPTVPDRSTPDEALQVLAEFDPERQLPASIYRAIAASASKSKEPTFPIAVLGNNAVAVEAAGAAAVSLGYHAELHSAARSEGLADAVGRELAERTLSMLRVPHVDAQQNAWVSGGEPVVRLADAAVRGRGGRNQQLVLAAYQRLLDADLSDAEWQQLLVLSGGTDGEDGPTDAAGAFVDGGVHDRATRAGLAPDDFLRRNDAYTFFEQTGGLLVTGPTGTNVCDVRVALVKD